ncbi:MAG TPA: YhbY family RNA-binding protein [Wenzhouxiangellaceae bacterium]|nr:YhbY family RNA-binding protein [Wenzhouxiangellaceae bacterium]
MISDIILRLWKPEGPMSLNNNQIRRLRGLCHELSPVVMVADKGLSENVRAEIEGALDSHELIKIKLRGEREQRREWIDQILAETSSELVQKIGQVACFYRPNPKNPKIPV